VKSVGKEGVNAESSKYSVLFTFYFVEFLVRGCCLFRAHLNAIQPLKTACICILYSNVLPDSSNRTLCGFPKNKTLD
jgi:hypothetical protein